MESRMIMVIRDILLENISLNEPISFVVCLIYRHINNVHENCV